MPLSYELFDNTAHILMPDSGAFSAWKKDVTINLFDYMTYIKRNQIGKYVVLNVVGDPDQTDFHLNKMEEDGLFPIAVFHFKTDFTWLDRYAAKYRYVALGGTVGKPKHVRDSFFREVFNRQPKLHYHGLGMTVPDIMRKYPWFSVDSTRLVGKKNGRIGTDHGQVCMGDTASLTEKIAANVLCFSKLEEDLTAERYAVTTSNEVIRVGAWGYEMFENDDACDVRDKFNKYMKDGMSVPEATQACVQWWPDCLNDTCALLAIAALQMEKRQLQPEIKRKCLQLIEAKIGLELWNDPKKRTAVLEAFKQRLLKN